MFGSKIRSWMENHITRPRKRGNKNKHNTSNNEINKKDAGQHQGNGVTTTLGHHTTNTANGHYGSGTSSSNNITSPVRRREVSPIQNHSRYGWQSPDSETITSPKSDNLLYAPQQQRARHHQQQQQAKEFHITNEKKLTHNTYHFQQTQHRPHQQQQQQIQNNSSSSFSSLSWSTGSKEQSSTTHAYNEHSSKTKINERSSQQCLVPTTVITFHGPNDTNYVADDDDVDNDNPDAVHYEEIQTILRQPNNLQPQERPKSEQLTSFAPAYRQHEIINNYAKDDTHSVRYGKLLPSRIQPSIAINGYNDNNNMQAGRHSFSGGSAESLSCNSYQTQQTFADFNGAAGGGPHQNWQSNRTRHTATVHSQQYQSAKNSVTASNGAYNAGGALPFHALSSPESAYSTGYSTDGTSPGACHNHPPEYYINMRTGTHYFPKSVNSLAIEAQRYKFGLNKIEEMSPIDPLPNVSFATASSKLNNSGFYVSPKHTFTGNQANDCQEKRPVGSHSPLVLRNAIMLPTLHGFESSSSSSPRQRCRIRTNPWYSTGDAVSTGMPSTTSSSSIGGMPFKQTVSTSATSSTLSSSKSSTSTFGQSNILTSSTKGRNSNGNGGCETFNYNSKDMYDSSSSTEEDEVTENGKHSTLSLTEVEARQRANNTFRIKRSNNKGEMSALKMPLYGGIGGAVAITATTTNAVTVMAPVVSDEDATLNEMMGKFDESYVYEKETDILSDSDATNCPSEMDTGLDAEDECDTDELLDIDFIDTSSMREAHDKKEFCFNGGNAAATAGAYCFTTSYESTTATARMSRRNRYNQEMRADSSDSKQQVNRRSGSSGSHRRRKRLIKTRKKNASECKESLQQGSPLQRSRETRSVGGTPISLRRNPTVSKERLKKISPMPVRASSLIFHHDQLMKADMEADMKYRQLIEEAESILVSLKSSTQTIPRETPVSSPRRLNPLVNKRVEMLKSFEGRQPQPQQQHQQQARMAEMEPDLSAALNKRIELLKNESSSVPNSPKNAPRFSPSKTHITNFIQQIDGQRKPNSNNNNTTTTEQQRISRTSNLHHGGGEGRLSRSPTPTSPLKTYCVTAKQNGRPITPNMSDFDSDLELENNEAKFLTFNGLKTSRKLDLANHNCLPEITRVLLRNGDTLDDFTNHNSNNSNGINMSNNNNNLPMPRFCPQSEPLKRKVYKGSNTFERLKFSFDLESGGPSATRTARFGKESFIGNVHSNTATQSTLSNASSQELSFSQLSSFNKKQLLLDTLSELKQNLENQSVELNGLNAN